MMQSILTLSVAAAALGVDTGWKSLSDGQLEYIIQIEPALLETLQEGEPITSEIPAHLRGVRRYRIMIGDGELPREDPPLAEPPVADSPVADSPVADSPVAEPAPTESPPGDGLPVNEPQLQAPEMPGRYQQPAEVSSELGLNETPDRLEPYPEARPIGHQQPVGDADANDLSVALPDVTADEPAEGATHAPAKPWWPLTLTAFGLCGSLGGNAYLGWILWSTRRRVRTLIAARKVGSR